MKRSSGSGAFPWIFKLSKIFKNDYLVVYAQTADSDILGNPYRDIFYKIYTEEMHSFLQHFGNYSFINYSIINSF